MYKIEEKRKIKEAKAWTRKYLIADSVEVSLFIEIIRGIKDKRFSSSPIHIPIQEEEDKVIKVPLIKVKIKINFEILWAIKKKRVITFIRGV